MDDLELRAHLRALGVDEHSWPAVAFLPLVQVAWADGEVQDAERAHIGRLLDAAALPGDGAELVRSWLNHRPSRGFFGRGHVVLDALARRGGLGDGAMAADDIVSACEAVAKAAGGLLGGVGAVEPRERTVLAEVKALLEPDGEDWSALLGELGEAPAGFDDDVTVALLAVKSEVPGAEDLGVPGPTAAHLVVRRPNGTKTTVGLAAGVTVGRMSLCQIAAPEDGTLSRRHCRFERDVRGWSVIDLGSRNGTFVDGERVERRRLFGGESVAAGALRIAVALPGGEGRL